ncbi:acetyl-CoA acetyltransferase [Amylibacter ulvae]|uniref:Acetyl-CoA acetyltransferase n=1 Tax=Paramylibacter ulvae TaxID=1651968 RepID=A0ABQ3CX30_9RHOB|nr:thiolase family protein [Amylibacter ulvae]GHA45915.1 acetyl-CoA acetyltransferase [Amylibacter ulvae]
MSKHAYVIAARRSAVMAQNGAFADVALHDLCAPVISATLSDAKLDSAQVDELILSNALYGGGNPARMAAQAAGLPNRVAGLSIDRQCVGGLDAILLATQMIQSGSSHAVIAGGGESASMRPIRMTQGKNGAPPVSYDRPAFSPFANQDPDLHVAANALNIPRNAQDNWAIESHAKAIQHRADLRREIVPIAGAGETDGFTRVLSPALCQRAKPIISDITAANTAISADGAAFVLVVSEQMLKSLGNPPALRIVNGITLGGDSSQPALVPIGAIENCLNQTGMAVDSLTQCEIMEAYAAQAIACVNGAYLDADRVNIKGGALARGHPIGASGAILAVRLFHDLVQKNGGTGLAAIAAAGGLGTALILAS